MMKTGTAAVLAIATLSAAVTAQSVPSATQPECAFMHCVGPEPGDLRTCCAGTRCVQKNEFYAQCLPNDMVVPALWVNGTVLLDRSPPGTESVNTTGDVVDDAVLDEDEDDVAAQSPVEDGDVVADKSVKDGGLNGTDVLDTEYSGDYDYVETPIDVEIPDELLDITYMKFVGRDYHPGQETALSVLVKDVPNGSYNVTSSQECEDLCTVTEECNAASYYINATLNADLNGVNCWLKTLDDACALPEDSSFDDNAIYLIQVDSACPEEALGPDSVADSPLPVIEDLPSLVPPAQEPAAPARTPTPRLVSNTPTVPIVNNPQDSSSVGVAGALVALAVAGAAALF